MTGMSESGKIPQTTPSRRATDKQRAYADARLRGLTPNQSVAEAGYSRGVDSSEVEIACRRLGILPDPNRATEELRAVVRSIEELRREGREWVVERLRQNREELLTALTEAAKSGNVPAIKEALDRYLGPEPLPKGQASLVIHGEVILDVGDDPVE